MTCHNCQTQNRAQAKFCVGCGAALANAPASTRLQSGQVMNGNYTIARELGRGGMGAVYLAQQTMANVQRQVVVKEMLDYYDPSDPQAASKALTRFQAEAATLVRLNIAHIPQIFDFFSEGGRNYIVMQYIEGPTLESRLTRGDAQGRLVQGQPYPSDKIRQWGAQLCLVLESLAAQNIVHMDIKPANLILDHSDQIWLVDFGTAKAQRQRGGLSGGLVGMQKSSIYGTAGYAPPEQYQGKAEPRSDVYALASTLYHLLTDDDPRDHPMNFPKLDQLPSSLADPLRNALQSDIYKRVTAPEFRKLLLANTTNALLFRWQDGTESRTPEELVTAADQRWQEALNYFTHSDWEQWLRSIHRNDVLTQLQQSKRQHAHAEVALDAFLRALNPHFPQPRLQVDGSTLQALSVAWLQQYPVTFEVWNSSSGCLQGSFKNVPRWLQIEPQSFAIRQRATIKVTVKATEISPNATPHRTNLLLDAGSGGTETLPVAVTVPEPRPSANKRRLRLGSLYRGEGRNDNLKVSNRGQSVFDGRVRSDAAWLTVLTPRFRCEPNASVRVKVRADTTRLGLGRHTTNLRIQAMAGDWTNIQDIPVVVRLPRFKNLWKYWSSVMSRISWGLVLMILLFLMARTQLFAPLIHNAGDIAGVAAQALQDGYAEIKPNVDATPIASIYPAFQTFINILASKAGLLLLILGGWIGVIVSPRKPQLDLRFFWGGFLLPWLYNLRPALMGSLLAIIVTELGISADLWLGFGPSIALAGGLILGWVILLNRTAKPSRQTPATIVPIFVFTAGLLALLYLMTQPAYLWRPADSLPIEANVVAISPTQNTIASGDRDIALYGVKEGSAIHEFGLDACCVEALTFSANGEFLVENIGGRIIQIRNLADGEVIKWPKLNEQSRATLLQQDNQTLLIGLESGALQLWELNRSDPLTIATGSETLHPGAITHLALSPDEKFFASSSTDETILLWERKGNRWSVKHVLFGHTDSINGLAFSIVDEVEGLMLASGSGDGTVRLWRVGDGSEVAILTQSVGRIEQTVDYLSDLWRNVWLGVTDMERDIVSVAFAPDGSSLAAGVQNGNVLVWRLPDYALARILVTRSPVEITTLSLFNPMVAC